MYLNEHSVRRALAETMGLDTEQVFLSYNGSTFDLATPEGVDWADYIPQPDLEIPQPNDEEGNPVPPVLEPQPDLRVPRQVWDWYRAQYPILAEDPPTPEAVEAWEPPRVEAPVLSEAEALYQKISLRLNEDEAKRTGRAVDPDGKVPVARAISATAMLLSGWNYPTVADLSVGANPGILQKIYADPSMKTNENSSVDQKRRVLHFTLVMLEGQQFGLDYQAELGAYERTASGQFRAKMATDKTRSWLDLPCPKMHKKWPEFSSVRDMFNKVMG